MQLGIHSKFTTAFSDKARRLNIGDPLDENAFMGPIPTQLARQKAVAYDHLAVAKGAEVLLEGGPVEDGHLSRGYFMSPFICRMAAGHDSTVLREEVFGCPVAIIHFETIEIYNDTGYGLAIDVITNDYRKACKLREECEFGVGYFNLSTIGADAQLPFGAQKERHRYAIGCRPHRRPNPPHRLDDEPLRGDQNGPRVGIGGRLNPAGEVKHR